ncbi:MAG: hypothetical protein AAFP86_06370 [Planctomycetota bacterium]
MTLVDVLMAMSILIVAVALTSVSITSSARYAGGAREKAIAYEAAEAMFAQLEAHGFATVYADYNASTADDAADSPGPTFTVDGLDPRTDDADGSVGAILFPETDAAPGTLREDLNDARFGLPADLDLDGAIDATDKSTSYRLLPVRIEVEWRGGRVVVDGMLSQW